MKLIRLIIIWSLIVWGSLFAGLHESLAGERYPWQPPALCGTPFFQDEALKLYRKYGKPTLMSKEVLMDQGRLDVFGKPVRAQVGDQATFWATNMVNSQFYQVTATLQKIGVHCYIYVEDGQTIAGTVLNNTASAFDTNIYPKNTNIFGSEPNVDGDPLVTILLLDILDGYTGSGGFTAGYFHPVNEFNTTHSNFREMLYIDLNPGQPGTTQSNGTVAHEFQHMIHFNQDGNEEVWVNEGCSTLSEYLCGYGHDSNIEEFLASPDNDLIKWGDELPDYGQVYLFFFYLWEKYGGNTFITHLTQNQQNGIDGVNSSLSARGYSADFNTVFSNWAVANYLDNTTIGGGKYGYTGLNIRSFRPEGIYIANIWSNYPVVSSGSVEHYAADYLKFTTGNNITFSFNGDDANRFRVFLIDETSSPQVTQISLNSSNDGASSTFTSFSSLVMIPMSVSSSGEKSYSFSSQGDASQSGRNYFLPYFTQKTGEWTGVGFSNCSTSQSANVVVRIYNQYGQEAGTQSQLIPPDGQQAFVVTAGGSTQEGWMLVNSDQPLTGLCFFGTSGSYNYMADITLIKDKSTTLHVPHVAQDNQWDTTIFLCNPNSSSTSVTLTLVNTGGGAGQTQSFTIPALGSRDITLSELLGTGTSFSGKVKITATQGIAAFALYTNLKYGGRCYSGVSAVEPEGGS